MSESIKLDHAKVDWFGDEVFLKILEATAEGLEAAAFDIEGLAKQNIVAKDLIDTGFMLNSVYAKGPKNSSYGGGGDLALPEANLNSEHEALVAVAAEYGIWPELKYPYLYPALEEGAARAGGHIEKAAKGAGF